MVDYLTVDSMVDTFLAAIGLVSPAASQALRQVPKAAGARLVLVWAQYGPYHLARLRALQYRLGRENVLGAEIANLTRTYAWSRQEAANVTTLLPGREVEQVSAAAVYRSALAFFRRERVTVVFAPSYWPANSLAVILAARSAGARVVLMNDSHQHTAKARGLFALVKRQIILHADAALVAGTAHRDYFVGMGMPPEKIALGYDAVDNAFFGKRAAETRHPSRREEIRAKYGLPQRFFLSVGRMIWKKNLETLIDAYKRAKDRLGSDCPGLVFVGSGPLEDALVKRCLGHGLSVYRSAGQSSGQSSGQSAGQSVAGAAPERREPADVYFLGFRQVNELPEFYALAECFVLPSREEEWGLVVNEAMACGLPVLVSNVAGCAPELVRPGENGFQFAPFDVAALADDLETIARQPKVVEMMGVASQRIVAEWGCERFAEGAHQAAGIAAGAFQGSADE